MIIAVDTGGTKTLIASFDKDGKMIDSIKYPTPTDKNEYIATLSEKINQKYELRNIDAIVVAIPGFIVDGVVKWCGNLPWTDFDIKTSLNEIFTNIPILIENDAKLAALGSAKHLDKPTFSALYITISTGIGCGLVINGKLDEGMKYSEIGHIPLEYNGQISEWEKIASGSAIVRDYKKLASEIDSKETWKEIADKFTRGFLVIIPTIQPDVIMIGGSIGTHFNKYRTFLIENITKYLPKHIKIHEIIQAKNPEEAVVYGEFYYAKDFISNRTDTV